ncbi:MAG: LytS/YhcK type 5TM receptor domain-containing protein [Dehalococcoidia bacterium]|nr:LytS/YhcK type 5TM receptor domain-containing protein [Dehalococcoidia bacterium]MDD5494722.1 LytS/YhcK type 5TM receptor domain-containing protein [Dehalococcoidia bacterium]
MDQSIVGILFGLIEKACFAIVIFYLLFHTQYFRKMLSGKINAVNQIVLAIVFGLFAIYGTYSGVQTSGAIANIRNLGPMMAGFVGGPWVGLGAGLIGGVHRYFMGGFTAIPCALGTILSGLIAGIILVLLKGKIGIWKPALFAFLMESLDMTMLLVMAQPFDKALTLVKIIAIPMILADTIGIAIFAYMLKQTFRGKDSGSGLA